jgi:LemA protein
MGPELIALLVVLGIVLLGLLWFIAMYNGLVRLRNEVKNAWAQIDVQLKRRHDLIPNLVETVKGYAGHEKSTLDAVVAARSRAVSAQGVENQARAEGELSQALSRLLMLVESYPNLKANENFLALQEELASTENRIGFSRQFYNDSVMNYNTRIQSFPPNIIAGMFGFSASPFFEIADQVERAVPQVKF